MTEGGLGAPIRHPLAWRDADFYDPECIDAELRRTFDICHGCRRCFNLCDSFPRLFDLIDDSETGELDSVDSRDFAPVIDACTLCDMCFMTKCPYVPPHEFNLDFPHLMLRYRAARHQAGKTGLVARALSRTDRNGKLARHVSGLVNWASNGLGGFKRRVIEIVAGIHRDAALPRFHRRTFVDAARRQPVEVNTAAPAYGRKAVLYATCFANYNNPAIGLAARAVLARNGVETEVIHPMCCGMPKLEHGDIEGVAAQARKVAGELRPWIDRGYGVIAPIPSCALMLKFEWPLIVPDDDDVGVLARATSDITEYVVDVARNEGLAHGLMPVPGGIGVHLACHARAQNMGAKAAEMLRLIPEVEVEVFERCSGHGGSWGIMKENFEVALKVGKPVARKLVGGSWAHIVSECPLAAEHIAQGMAQIEPQATAAQIRHPIELFARAYGISV